MKLTRFLTAICGFLALTAAFDAAAGVNSWTHQGPVDGGGSVSSITTHPTDANVALIGTSRGIARTTDAGLNWTLVKDDTVGVPHSIAYDPTNPSRVVASDGLIYLSEDGGLTYAVAQGPTQYNNVNHLAFGANGTLYATTYGGHVYRAVTPFGVWVELGTAWPAVYPGNGGSSPTFITVDPNNPQVLYVGVYHDTLSGMFRSTDGGATWLRIDTGIVPPPTTSYILFNKLAVNPGDPTMLLAATSAGLHLSTNSGTSWTYVDGGYATWVGFDPAAPQNAYSLSSQELRHGTNGGTVWNSGNVVNSQWATGLAFQAGAVDGMLVATALGVARTTSTHTTWEYRNRGITGTAPRELTVADDGTIYVGITAASNDIFYRDGNVFRPLPAAPLLGAINSSRTLTAISVAAEDSDQIFAINASYDLIRTFDRGEHWTAAHPAFSVQGGDYLNDVLIDPTDAQVAYVARALTGVWKTTNGGTTFAALAGFPASYAHTIAISPYDSAVLYVGGGVSTPSGIYKSTDGGVTWTTQLAPSNTPGLYFNSFSFHPTDPQVVYATSWSSVYRTTDGGAHWSMVDFGAAIGGTNTSATAVLFDPLIPTTISMISPAAYPGFARSVDGGLSWELVRYNLDGPYSILTGAVLDPNDSAVVLATTNNADLAEYRVSPNLSLAMSTLGGPLASSGSTPVTFTVRNLGPNSSSASELVITVPAWITPSGTGCTAAAQTLTCRHGALRVDQSRQIQVTLAVGAGGGSGTISATLTGHEEDMAPGDNTLSQAVSAAEIADVDVSLDGGPQVIDRGATTNASVTVSNAGPSPSTATVITLQIPPNVSYSNLATSPGTTCQSGGPRTLSCSAGTMAANGSATITLTLTGEAAGQGAITVDVDGAGTDPDGANSASRTLTVRPVTDMRVALAESADPVTVGVGFQYIATVTNNGPDATGFQVSIPVSGAALLTASAESGICSVAAGTATCTSPELAPGSSNAITLNLNSAVPAIATASATLTITGTDSDPSNNSATIGTNVRLVGDVSVEVTDSADPVAIGASYDYIVTTRNAGPNAGAVQVVIPVTNATVIAATTTGATCTRSATSVTCDIASLASGGSHVINVMVTGTAAGNASAAPTATFGGFEADAANNTATQTTLVRVTGDIGVTVTDSVDPVTAGTPYSYTVTVSNTGPNAGAVNISVPVTGATVTGATLAGGTCTNTASTVTCDIASLVSGGSAALTINVSAATVGAASAAATVTFSGTDPVATNNAATANTVVNAPPLPPAPPISRGSGGGGGGSFDWLALTLLGLLAARRRFAWRAPALDRLAQRFERDRLR